MASGLVQHITVEESTSIQLNSSISAANAWSLIIIKILCIPYKMILANNAYPEQMPQKVVADQCLHRVQKNLKQFKNVYTRHSEKAEWINPNFNGRRVFLARMDKELNLQVFRSINN